MRKLYNSVKQLQTTRERNEKEKDEKNVLHKILKKERKKGVFSRTREYSRHYQLLLCYYSAILPNLKLNWYASLWTET